jgi:hypothetical protein
VSSVCPEYGFAFSFRVPAGTGSDDARTLWSEFIRVVESRGLSAGGGVHGDVWHHVISREGSPATDDDRHALLAWARGRADVVDAVAGPVIDINADEI